MITQEELKNYFKYNIENGEFICTKARGRISIGAIAGKIDKGNVYIYFKNKKYTASKLAFLYMEGFYPSSQVLFLNDNKLDLKWENLFFPNGILDSITIKKLFTYDKDSGIFYWNVSINRMLKGEKAGNINTNGYIVISIFNKKYYAHRLAFLYMLGELPIEEVDHINNNPSNNTWSNLRLATSAQNSQNMRKSSIPKSSIYKGVSWYNQLYHVKIQNKGKTIHLGSYTSEIEAAKVYDKKAKELFKNFANLNFQSDELT